MQPNPPPPPRGTGLKLQTPLNHFTFGLSGTTGHVVSGSDPLRQHPPPPPKRMHMLLHTRSGLYSGAAEEQIKQFTPNLRSEA